MTFFGYKPSTLALWVVLSLPALTMIDPLLGDNARAFHRLLHPTGEWAARFMIIGMMASGLMLLFRKQQWPRWLMRHRRGLGVAAFAYATLHLVVYVIDRGALDRIIEHTAPSRHGAWPTAGSACRNGWPTTWQGAHAVKGRSHRPERRRCGTRR